MNIGQKMNEVFGTTEHSPETERGVVDHRTPGSFPSDEPSTTTSGTTGGVTGKDRLGHSHTDSGVGFTSTEHDQSPTGHKHDTNRLSEAPGNNNIFGNSVDTNQSKASNSDPSTVVGTGAAAAGAGGLSRSAIGEDRSGQKPAHSLADDHRDTNTNTTTHSTLSQQSQGSHLNDHHNVGRDVGATAPGTAAAGAGSLSKSAIGGDRSGQKPAHTLADEHRDTNTNTTTQSNLSQHSQGNQLNEHHNAGRDAGATTAATNELHNIVINGKANTNIDHEDPYWGDLPQGAGVYNSVVGHGSGEDTTAQHRHIPQSGDAQPSPASTTTTSHLPIGAGVYNTVTGHGSNRADDGHHLPGTVDPTASTQREGGSPFDSSKPAASQDAKHSDESKTGQHAAEAGAGLGAGAATYGALHKHKDNADDKHMAAQQSKSNTKHEESHDSKLGGILHKSHDDKDATKREHQPDESKSGQHAAEAGAGLGAGAATYGVLHKRKDDEDAKHASQTEAATHQSKSKDTKHEDSFGSKLVGIFHRSHDDKDAAKHEHKQEKKHEEKVETKHHQKEPTAAAGIIGVSHTKGNESDAKNSAYGAPAATTSAHQQPGTLSSAQTPSQQSHDVQPSHDTRNMAGVAGLGAGAAAGYGASRLVKHDDEHRSDQSPITTRDTAHQIINSTPASSSTTQGTAAPYEQPSNFAGATTTPSSVSHATSNLDNSHGATLSKPSNQFASGTASGIADQHVKDSSITGSQNNDPYNHLSSGTTSGVHNPNHSGTGGVSAVKSHTTDHSSSATSGHSDNYNHLSSGTPSGVDLEAKHTN